MIDKEVQKGLRLIMECIYANLELIEGQLEEAKRLVDIEVELRRKRRETRRRNKLWRPLSNTYD